MQVHSSSQGFAASLSHTTASVSSVGTFCKQTSYVQIQHLVGMNGSITDSLHKMGRVLNIWYELTG